jgi:hypothetical protein
VLQLRTVLGHQLLEMRRQVAQIQFGPLDCSDLGQHQHHPTDAVVCGSVRRDAAQKPLLVVA